MKKKTSISLEENILEKLQKAAESQQRSTSFLIEKTIEGVLAEIEPEEDWADAVTRYSRKVSAQPKKRKAVTSHPAPKGEAKHPIRRQTPGQEEAQ